MYDFSNLKPLSPKDPDLVQVEWLKYYKVEWPKKQIVLHHTVSGPGIQGDMETWKAFKSHIAVCIIIERDGKMNQLFPSKYWGYHLGVGNAKLDQASIAIELDNWGGLIKGNGKPMKFGQKTVNTIDGKIYNSYGGLVNVPVTHYPEKFRGYEYFESYTEEQLRATGELLLFWSKNYNIPLTYKEEMWDVSQKALNGEPGVWTHVSYRKPSDKQDCHPDPELKNLLKTLPNLI